jgi:hypothetical protein
VFVAMAAPKQTSRPLRPAHLASTLALRGLDGALVTF